MKKYKLRNWVKVALLFIAIFNLVMILKIMDREFIKRCTNAGYSETYCIAHK